MECLSLFLFFQPPTPFFFFIFLLAMTNTHMVAYLCGQTERVHYQPSQSETQSGAGWGIWGISVTQCFSLPPHHPPTGAAPCLHRDMGAGHPSLTQKKDSRDEIQVRSHRQAGMQAGGGSRVRTRLFLERQREENT